VRLQVLHQLPVVGCAHGASIEENGKSHKDPSIITEFRRKYPPVYKGAAARQNRTLNRIIVLFLIGL
jgi:hypothetical protein